MRMSTTMVRRSDDLGARLALAAERVGVSPHDVIVRAVRERLDTGRERLGAWVIGRGVRGPVALPAPRGARPHAGACVARAARATMPGCYDPSRAATRATTGGRRSS
jgi:hypothetical protein